jgi:6-phosphofructokinase 1
VSDRPASCKESAIVTTQNKLAILCAGGPAPGLNSVISAATIRACLSNVEVLGLQDGFQWVMQGDTSHVVPLTIPAVSSIHTRGGSEIGTARANPTKKPESMGHVLESLKKLGVGMLITIGGDDTCYSASRLALAAGGSLRVAHVPKTIDNDLDLPPEIPTFGYQTARHVGVGIVHNLIVDAKTTHRWYFVVAMGRKAGHLALGIGKASAATLTVIPEEFGSNPPRMKTIVDILAGSILKRLAAGRADGVVVLAEGLVEAIPAEDLSGLPSVERDEHGHIRIDEVSFGDMCKHAVRARLAAFGLKPTMVAKNIGYEVRCADPIPFDIEYTRDLGFNAAKFVIDGGSNALVSMQQGRFKAVPFDQIMNPETGRMRVRMVDVSQENYRVASEFMIRLTRKDFEDPAELAKLAAVTKITPAKFRSEFEHVV